MTGGIMKFFLAVFALADTIIIAAIIRSGIADHVKEYAIELIIGNGFFQYFLSILLLITTIRTSMNLAVIIYIFACGRNI